MRRLRRLQLSPATLAFLRDRALQVSSAAEQRREVDRLWGLRRNRAFDEIRETLGRMASGLRRCMYCEDSEGTDIDHFWPKSVYPERAFNWSNYLLGCSRCNSNFKRDRFPLDVSGQPLLLNPIEEDPLDHLSLSSMTGRYEPLPGSAKAEPSIDVFGLNRTILVRGRRIAWVGAEQLLVRYAQHRSAGRSAKAGEIEETLRKYPFSGVLAALLRIANGPAAELLVERECLQAIHSHPEVESWLEIPSEPDL